MLTTVSSHPFSSQKRLNLCHSGCSYVVTAPTTHTAMGGLKSNGLDGPEEQCSVDLVDGVV